jgi:hypothetical protein
MERFIGRVVTEIRKDHKGALNLNGRSLILTGIPNGLRVTETVRGKRAVQRGAVPAVMLRACCRLTLTYRIARRVARHPGATSKVAGG